MCHQQCMSTAWPLGCGTPSCAIRSRSRHLNCETCVLCGPCSTWLIRHACGLVLASVRRLDLAAWLSNECTSFLTVLGLVLPLETPPNWLGSRSLCSVDMLH